MRIITANVNGIRSAAKKGFFTWLNQQHADVVCLQEIKAQAEQLNDPLFHPPGYHVYFFPASCKKGYSGVAIYSKKKPENVQYGLGFATADTEGRYIQIDFEQLSVASLYLPSGSSGEERQQVKFAFMDQFMEILKNWRQQQRQLIIGGDWNTVHQRIDIKNFSSNQKNSGCLPEERAWIDALFTEVGYVDAFRVINKNAEQYTWWSNRGQAWANNVGWRIDYQIITPGLRDAVYRETIYRDEKFSDHAPLIIDYNI
ncbi:MAG: exodeoxyribonuclease III [Legionellales bacterium]|nr:exodeoxyribonuclease III [Legionellales bacterium]